MMAGEGNPVIAKGASLSAGGHGMPCPYIEPRNAVGARHAVPSSPRAGSISRVGTRIAILVVAWLAALLVLPAAPAAAHAFLESSEPTASAVLPTAPPTVTLRFTEPLETSYSRAQLFDQTGAEVAGAVSAVGPEPRAMTVSIPAGLANGTYSILWRTLSTADGHTAQGYVPFTIGTQADVTAAAEPTQQMTSGAMPEWTLPVARWLALLGLAAVAAVWPAWVLVVRPALSPVWQLGPKTTRRVRRYAVGAFAFSLAANIVALLVQAMAISGPGDLLAGLTTTIGQTRYGTWWLVRVGVLLVFAAMLLGVAWWRPWQRRVSTVAALIASAVLPLPFSMISHAGAEPAGQATAIAFDYVHLLGAALWAGGILFLAVALGPTVRDLTGAGRRVVLGRAIPRFSLLALIAWGAMGFTGLYSAWLQVGNIPALTQTPYGQTLLLKLILIVPLLLLGAFNLAVVTRKLRQAQTEERAEGWGGHFVTALTAEAVIVTLLLGVVGMLIGTPPARQIMEQQANSLRISLQDAGQFGTLVITPGGVGQNQYRLELGSGHEAHLRDSGVTDATLRVELPERQTGQIDIPLTSAPSGGYEAQGSELAFPGDWRMQVTVRMPGQPDWVATATPTITAEAAPNQVPSPPPLFGPSGIAALVLVVLGIAGIVFGIYGRTPTFRKEAAGLGAAAIAVGAVLLFQAQLSPTAVASIEPAAGLAALDPAAVVRGQTLFAQNCTVCHGAGARGDGPGAASLRRPPADLTAGHALPHSDDDYAYWIENGIEGTDMPAFGDELDDGQVTDVIAYVRSLQQTALLARDAPGPEDCTVEPRTMDEIAALANEPAPVEPPNAMEVGDEQVDEATGAEIRATARELVACRNAGDIMRRLALYSDDRLRYAYPDGPTRVLETIAANPLPLSLAERVALTAVEDLRLLDDGRVSARMQVDNPAAHSHDPNVSASATQQEAARLIFVREDGRWRVDETRREDVRINATPVAATGGP
jgi:copper transport protein